jgi:hypothetical protein
MALLFMESWDGYGGTNAHATKWANVSLRTSSATPRTGTHCCAGNPSRPVSPGGAGTIILGLANYWTTLTTKQIVLHDAIGGYNCTVVLEGNGTITVRNGTGSGTVLATSAAVLVANSWNYIEIKVLVANAGSYVVRCNGAEVLNGTGDTQATSTPGVGSIELFDSNSPGGWDDIYCLDTTGSVNNDFLGDCKVECLSPQAGNGSNVGLTCSTGTDHGALVDELPANDDTDYAYSATAGAKDTYTFTNVATVGVIKAVQVSARARKTDVAPKTLAIVTRVGGVDSDGPAQAVASTTYGQYQQLLETKPGGGAWTIADVNAAEFGLKVVS